MESDRDVQSKPAVANTKKESAFTQSGPISRQAVTQKLQYYFQEHQILNFMIVGGIGYAINMFTYWPLTLVFKNEVNFLGQNFYLPPFIFSSLIAILSNYELNKLWTFKGWNENKLGSVRYFTMALGTLLIDMSFLFIMVQFLNLAPVPSAALAILIVFIIRYSIARSWVWSKKS